VSQETLDHIRRVQKYLHRVAANLMERARVHDTSKLSEPEASVFAEFTPKLKNSTYGSDEYKQFLAAMKPALDHHYKNNRHHPEHWPNGIQDMSLVDLIEMFCDWKAATERHADGSLLKSIEMNKKRFGYGDELERIFLRTAIELFAPHNEPWHCLGCGNGGAVANFCEMCGAGKNDYVQQEATA
jgi:hypothetical protein